MNKVIVTGAAGFVGSAVVKECLNHGLEVIALDMVENPVQRLPLGNPHLVYICQDLTRFEDLFDAFLHAHADTFMHFAWRGSAGPLREDYECQVENALLSVKLLSFAKRIGCLRFVFAGTIMEFETNQVVYAQGSHPQMSYLYGVGKSLAHQLCKPVANKLGVDLIWGYITNAFGEGECSPRLINTTIRKCINNEELRFTSGTQNYDFVYIDDVAHAFWLLGEKGIPNKSYMIGSGRARPLKEFLCALVDVCDCKSTVHFGDVPFTGVNQPLDIFSIADLQIDCGYSPLVSFEEGVRRTKEWMLTGGDQ